jgi:hypothetical protein
MLFRAATRPRAIHEQRQPLWPVDGHLCGGATLYRAIAGNRPIRSTERSLKDQLRPATAIGRPLQEGSYARSMRPSAASGARPRTAAAWRAQLLDAGPSARHAFCNHPHPSAGSSSTGLPPRSSAAARRVADISERSREHVLRAWHSLSPQQRRLGMGAGSALVLVALAAVSAGPLLRSGAAPQPSAPAIASGQVPRIETPAPALPPISRPLPSTRPGSIATLPVKLGALVSEPHKAWLAKAAR